MGPRPRPWLLAEVSLAWSGRGGVSSLHVRGRPCSARGHDEAPAPQLLAALPRPEVPHEGVTCLGQQPRALHPDTWPGHQVGIPSLRSYLGGGQPEDTPARPPGPSQTPTLPRLPSAPGAGPTQPWQCRGAKAQGGEAQLLVPACGLGTPPLEQPDKPRAPGRLWQARPSAAPAPLGGHDDRSPSSRSHEGRGAPAGPAKAQRKRSSKPGS